MKNMITLVMVTALMSWTFRQQEPVYTGKWNGPDEMKLVLRQDKSFAMSRFGFDILRGRWKRTDPFTISLRINYMAREESLGRTYLDIQNDSTLVMEMRQKNKTLVFTRQ